MYDCAIDFEKDTQPPFWTIYNFWENDLATLRKYMGEHF
jgi:hypothetical protein